MNEINSGINAKDMKKVIEKMGFRLMSEINRHIIYQFSKNRMTTLPVKNMFLKGKTIIAICKDLEISLEELKEIITSDYIIKNNKQ